MSTTTIPRATGTRYWSPEELQDKPPRTVRVRELNHRYGEGDLAKQVLFDNHLDVHRGEIVIMTGPSGSGKTTLLTLIGTLRKVQEGSLQVLDRELNGASTATIGRLRREAGFIFQAHNLFESLTATENVSMALELFGRSRREVRRRAGEMLERVGLGHRVNYKPESLSGGQRQRVAIARGLVHRPKLVLADEPTAALDEKSGREVVTLFQELAKEEGCTILMVTHDNRILDVADRIVNMVDGRIKSDVLVEESSVICELLQGVSAFRDLTPRTLTEVADSMLIEEHAPGATIIQQGDAGDKFYLIRRGRVDVYIDDGATKRRVNTLRQGQSFGETALLTGDPRNATIVAAEDCVLYTLGKEDFLSVVENRISLAEEQRRALFDRT